MKPDTKNSIDLFSKQKKASIKEACLNTHNYYALEKES